MRIIVLGTAFNNLIQVSGKKRELIERILACASMRRAKLQGQSLGAAILVVIRKGLGFSRVVLVAWGGLQRWNADGGRTHLEGQRDFVSRSK